MDDKVLLKVINHCIGVIGYFDGRATAVNQSDEKVLVSWSVGDQRKEPLLFDPDGTAIFEDGVAR